jgi:hypothetical protein
MEDSSYRKTYLQLAEMFKECHPELYQDLQAIGTLDPVVEFAAILIAEYKVKLQIELLTEEFK